MKKIKAVFPFLVLILVQVLAGIVAGLIVKNNLASTNPEVMNNATLYVAAYLEEYEKLAPLAVYASHYILAVIMLVWFVRLCKKLAMADITLKQSLTKKNLLMALCFGFGIQLSLDAILNALVQFLPDLMEKYTQTLQGAGISGLSVGSFLAAGICAPIGEELAFRGITLKYLKKAGAGFAVANVIQALLFALAHLNIVQSSYTFVLGLFFGYLACRYNSVWVSVFVHVATNLCGLAMGTLIVDGSNPAFWFCCIITGIAALIAGCLINKNNEVVSPVTEENFNSVPQEETEQV